MRELSQVLLPFTPFLLVVIISSLLLLLVAFFSRRRVERLGSESRLPMQLSQAGVLLLALVFAVIVFPMSDTLRGQIFSLLGVLITAVIALSSTTFVANAMAGLMLRAVNSFRPGDFVRIGDAFGRVSERGLFHTEVQTEDRDLTTFPNLYFVNNAITVVRKSGTIVSATVSLGYELSWHDIEELLKRAAANAGLEDAFVQVTELGDYSVNYRVAGFLPEVTQVLTARSNLRKQMLDVLHSAGVEIVSPAFMKQIPVSAEQKVLAKAKRVKSAKPGEEPEAMIFDKASDAAALEQLRERRNVLQIELKGLRGNTEESERYFAAKAELESVEQELSLLQAEERSE